MWPTRLGRSSAAAVSALPDPGGSVAVLIGASVYDSSAWEALPAIANNVHDLASTLADEELWGLPADRIVVLLDRDDPSEIMAELAEGSRRAEDTFIVYFAGHGVLSDHGDLHLATRKTRRDVLALTSVPYSLVRQVVDRCRAQRRIVILDCCFSGRALRAMSDTASAVIGQVDVEGTYVLTSSPGTSTSIAPEGARYTAFTSGLLTTLREGIAGRSDVLSLDDVYEDVMQAMARFSWPRPQQLGSNLIGRLGIVRNRAVRLLFPRRQLQPDVVPERPADFVRRAAMAAGISAAVEIVSERFGEQGSDGLRALAGAVESDPDREAGRQLVLDTMRVMREQYGDGATLSAIVLGGLVTGLQTLLEDGASPGDLDARLAAAAGELRQRLLDPVTPTSGAGHSRASTAIDVRWAVITAIGTDAVGAAVADACDRVGADRVEVLPGSGPVDVEDGSFTIDTSVLSPNALAGPIAMVEPLIAVSIDGHIDEREVRAVLGTHRRDLLIIAPRVGPHTIRAFLHLCSRIVVVRPTDARLDLDEIRNRLLDRNGRTCGTARRVIVLAESTTIDRPSLSLGVGHSREIVRVDPSTDERVAVAVRALAAARAATHGPVVSDGLAFLRRAAQPCSQEGSDDLTAAVRELVSRAAAAPLERIDAVPTSTSPFRRDCVTTLGGAVSHAAASARRFLC